MSSYNVYRPWRRPGHGQAWWIERGFIAAALVVGAVLAWLLLRLCL